MLTPKEIQEVLFEQSVLGGYKKEEVDAFLDRVQEDYQKMFDENAELVEKIKICVDKIEEYREDEKFLKTAIVNAQKMQEAAEKEIQLKEKESELSAREKAAEIIAEAEKKAKSLLESAHQQVVDQIAADKTELARFESEKKEKMDSLEKELDLLQNHVSSFRADILEQYQKHIELIEKLPQVEVVDADDEAQQDTVETVVETPAEEVEEQPEEAVKETVEEVVEQAEEPSVLVEEETEDEDSDMKIRFKNLKFGVDFDVNNDK